MSSVHAPTTLGRSARPARPSRQTLGMSRASERVETETPPAPAKRVATPQAAPEQTPAPAVQAVRAGAGNRESKVGAKADPSAKPAAAWRVIRVLCVDDHAVLVEGLRAQFAIAGHIEVVGRLGSAARLVEEVQRLNPAVVLMDIEMPGPDAFEMADRLKRSHPQVRVVMLSAHIRDGYISASFAAGVSGYFSKSDDLDDIVTGIREVVRKPAGSFVLGPKVRERCRPLSGGEGAGADPAAAGSPQDEAAQIRAGGPITLLSSLTTREAEVLRLIGRGLSRVQIAAQLCRSVKTVDGHQDRMMKKLGIPARADLMRFAIREGLAQA